MLPERIHLPSQDFESPVTKQLVKEKGTIKMDFRKTDFEDGKWIEVAWNRFKL